MRFRALVYDQMLKPFVERVEEDRSGVQIFANMHYE